MTSPSQPSDENVVLDGPGAMDRVLQYNFGYLPPRGSKTNLPLSMLATKRPLMDNGNGSLVRGNAKKVRAAPEQSELDARCIGAVRVLSAEMVQQANSGHPGAPMGCAPIAHVLWSKVMAYNPSDPAWANRDRFVLSNGHACALLYSMLHLSGYSLSLDDLKAFRQFGSKTPGHPEVHVTPGVEVCTGPLGQGIANGVGLAMASAHLGATFNREGYELFDNFTYVLCGDGCMQEGVSGEACSLAGHLGLGRLIVLYDDNKITIDGSTDLSFSEDVSKRYESYGWQTLSVERGDTNVEGICAAIERAKAELSRPTLIKVATTIGYGSGKAGMASVHGAPLGQADLAQLKRKSGFDEAAQFAVPADVRAHYAAAGKAGEARARVGGDGRALRVGARGALGRAAPSAGGRAARRLARRAAHVDARRQGSRHAPVEQRGPLRGGAGGARADRRLGRPDAVESDQI